MPTTDLQLNSAGSVAERSRGVIASAGFFSVTGQRPDNQDFAAAVFGEELSEPRGDIVAAVADGIGGAKGGRVAAETAVRGFLDGMCELPETTEVRRSAARVLDALNAWMHAQSHRDARLTGMGCCFTGLVLRGRVAHIVHVGDTRAYRLSGNRLTRLTTDHVRSNGAGRSRALYRALGLEAELRLDYLAQPMTQHDRFLLCSDGVHGSVTDEILGEILGARSAPADTARSLVASALGSGSSDNSTALVLDVVELPTRNSVSVSAAIAQLQIMPMPRGGESVDGFVLKALISDGRYSCVYAAVDEIEGGEVALKFPKPKVVDVAVHRAAFLREIWVGTHLNNPGLGRIIELPQGRQTCLYSVMPLYEGELLETRLSRQPSLGLEEGRNIAIKLSRAAAALHRDGIIHRDIKPDNVILQSNGSLKLIDLGVVRVRALEDLRPEEIPGTQAYVAPEMFSGELGNEGTDIYALGVTMFRAFTGEFPYGNPDADSPPNRQRAHDLTVLRPDLPSWLQAVLAQAIAIDPSRRFHEMSEFAMEMESGPARVPVLIRRPLTLYERAPLRFWQGLAALLALALLVSLLWR